MASMGPERGQPVLLQPAENLAEARGTPKLARPRRPSALPLIAAVVLGLFWIGTAAAYLVGLYGLPGLLGLAPPVLVLTVTGTFLPPILMVMTAWAFLRGEAMSRSAEALADVTERLFTADETAARTAARLGRAVRREIDALNAGLDGAFTRLRSLETALETQIAGIDEAGARALSRADAVGAQLGQERERLEAMSGALSDSANRAGEFVAGRAAQLKATIDAAEGALKASGATLEAQAAQFRVATAAAAEAPHAAAVELDRQAKRIEAVSDAAMARAEFVLGRHERHRTAMNDLLQRLKDEGQDFEHGLTSQRTALETAIAALQSEAAGFTASAREAQTSIDALMESAGQRGGQLSANYRLEVERLKEISDGAAVTLGRLVQALRDAGDGAQTLISDVAHKTQSATHGLVGDAMGECQRLLHLTSQLAVQSDEIKHALGEAVAEVERHLLTLPGVAHQEAARVRDMVKSETDEILNLSARTLSAIHARNAQRGVRVAIPHAIEAAPAAPEEPESDGLLSLARKFTQRGKRKEEGKWEMSQLLAAAESSERGRDLRPAAAAALGALQAALADLAIDLDAMTGGDGPMEDDWKRYLAGDRAIFARRIARTLDEASIERIAALYRDNVRFHEAANLYLSEFETLLGRAQDGDGAGLLASSLLSADTGKIYLAIAYALGRLS